MLHYTKKAAQFGIDIAANYTSLNSNIILYPLIITAAPRSQRSSDFILPFFSKKVRVRITQG